MGWVAAVQVQRELEEERKVAEEEARKAQAAIKAKKAELQEIEAARRLEVGTLELLIVWTGNAPSLLPETNICSEDGEAHG